MNNQIKQQLLDQFNTRVFDESFVRIRICLDMLSEEQVWTAPNESSNSVGNLILHLIGNGRQWIFNGLLGQEDHRARDREFMAESACSKGTLLEIMSQFQQDCQILRTSQISLTALRPVQVFEESGVSILIHVIEHMSYHTGQIALLTKLMVNEDLGFYGDLEL